MSEVDSKEELYMSWWLSELKEAGYIKSYQLHPQSYILSNLRKYKYDKQLKTKTKEIETTLIAGHVYTADFEIKWHEKARHIFFNTFRDKVYLKKIPFVAQDVFGSDFSSSSIVEIKVTFDRFHTNREFSINQKWMLLNRDLYVQKIVVAKLFEKTFVPERYLMTDKSGKRRKIKFEVRSLREFINDSKV